MPGNTLSGAKIMLLAAVLLGKHQTTAYALRMINLDAPETALHGDTIQLSCFFSLQQEPDNRVGPLEARQTAKQESRFPNQQGNKTRTLSHEAEVNKHDQAFGEQVYAIKWYKDEREFFRYLVQDWPKKQSFPLDGVTVDVEKSNNHTIVLENVSLKTSGTFRCEVSTDAPSFVTKSITRKMFIYSLPDQGPVIEPLKPMAKINGDAKSIRYYIEEPMEFICSSSESKPAAELHWIINDSLNLSSHRPKNPDGSPMFQIKEQRFVRLPSFSNGSVSGTNRPLVNHIPFRQTARPIPHVTYELLNGTVAVPVYENSGAASVGLANSVHQLVEMSRSRLKFTVDSNLLHLIERSKLEDSNKEQESNNRLARSPENYHQPAFGGQFVSVRSSQIHVQTPEDTLPTWTTIKTQPTSNSPVSFIRQHIGSISQTHRASFVADSSSGRKKGIIGKALSTVTTDKHKVVVRLKCVATVLHLSMAGELRLRLGSKPKAVDGELASIGAQRRQNQNDGNSGTTKYFELRQNINIIYLINALIMSTYQWKVGHIIID